MRAAYHGPMIYSNTSFIKLTVHSNIIQKHVLVRLENMYVILNFNTLHAIVSDTHAHMYARLRVYTPMTLPLNADTML